MVAQAIRLRTPSQAKPTTGPDRVPLPPSRAYGPGVPRRPAEPAGPSDPVGPSEAVGSGPPPFNPAYFAAVFLVPCPPPAWPRTFAVVTAHNPEGRVTSDRANDEQARRLLEVLAREGLDSFAVVGASPDLVHQEAGRGFAVDSVSRAAAIARRFRQEAFYWVENGEIFLCTDDSGRRWPVAPWSSRLVPADC